MFNGLELAKYYRSDIESYYYDDPDLIQALQPFPFDKFQSIYEKYSKEYNSTSSRSEFISAAINIKKHAEETEQDRADFTLELLKERLDQIVNISDPENLGIVDAFNKNIRRYSFALLEYDINRSFDGCSNAGFVNHVKKLVLLHNFLSFTMIHAHVIKEIPERFRDLENVNIHLTDYSPAINSTIYFQVHKDILNVIIEHYFKSGGDLPNRVEELTINSKKPGKDEDPRFSITKLKDEWKYFVREKSEADINRFKHRSGKRAGSYNISKLADHFIYERLNLDESIVSKRWISEKLKDVISDSIQ